MEHTQTTDTLLWCLTGFIVSIMATFLILGWLKGLHWEKERELKKRYR